ncbi:hypothetical protein DMENIID0001_077310 [Sergentomyia squamirostris]
MKYLYSACLFLIFWVSVSQSLLPSDKCREEVKNEECILSCEYYHYNFVQKSFAIPRIYIENFKNVLLHYKVVDENQSCELEKHIKACAEKMRITEEMKRKDKCMKVIEYFDCVVDGKMVKFNEYAEAIYNFDKSINL